jgi:transposase
MHGIDLKNAAVHMYKHCTFSLRQVVSMLGNRFSKSSLQRWIQGHPATKRLFAPRSKVTSQVQDALDSYISSNPFATSQDVSDHLMKELNVSLSPSTVRCWRKKIGFTRKRTYARAPDTEAVKQQQKEYVMKAMDLDIDDSTPAKITSPVFAPPPHIFDVVPVCVDDVNLLLHPQLSSVDLPHLPCNITLPPRRWVVRSDHAATRSCVGGLQNWPR